MPKLPRKLTHSPFRYPGGKFYARKLILNCIPQHDKYCEPFAGGASIFFAKPNVREVILNDKDAEVMNCYIQIRDNVEEIIEFIRDIPASKELHTFYKNTFKPKSNLERAARWFYLNRTSYSGIMKHRNCYWGYGDKYSMRPENWPHHLKTTSERLQNINLYCMDFEDLINLLPNDYFLFIDPPYFNADQDKFYTCSFSMEDHYRLCQTLKNNTHRLRFLITYDNSEEIRSLYNWCVSMQDNEWNYTISRTDDQRNNKKRKDGYKSSRYKGREIFITNYNPNDILSVRPLTFNTNNSQKLQSQQTNTDSKFIQLSLF
ncbi:MAG: DNA adenine methylase [Spirulina sp.]